MPFAFLVDAVHQSAEHTSALPLVFGFCWMKSGVAACVQSISEKHH